MNKERLAVVWYKYDKYDENLTEVLKYGHAKQKVK